MKLTLTHYTIIVLIVTTGIASFGSYHYSTEYEKQKEANGHQATEIQQLTDTINYQNTHIDMLHEMDTKHTQELDNAKSEIDTLRADVAAGRRKLRIKAICPVSETTSSRGMVDATTVELSGETGSTILDIREGIINDLAKLRYLQDYIKTECSR
ncbi:lysis protein [Xenorhabdus bovienii]|uniref:lysis protein n=1 Tax=Xenorhabdus bovienii TaxID=40576 RepID=UPI0023B2FDD4|nr:lysis protein [Xenorhabdus bovienii]MDE9432775.1 lysis protein [Xenorhabdus bovienii]MDE9490551.1 lysis protein [Xenorhabdus bovienii]MDE9507242.1 lysis protein [Xenorhabdus bovienii]